MKLRLRKSDQFGVDFEEIFQWYENEGDRDVADRFLLAVDLTLQRLAEQPGSGRERRAAVRQLRGVHSVLVVRPFNAYIIFYRYDANTLDALRIIHGARDLPRRLLENGSDQLNESAQ